MNTSPSSHHSISINLAQPIAHEWQDFCDSEEFKDVMHQLGDIAPDFHEKCLFDFNQDQHPLPFLCSFKLTNDAEIQQLNRDFRHKDKPTNVLSFPNGEEDETDDGATALYLGDIIFAYETIAKEAVEQNKSFTAHFTHLCVHGLLHVLGYDHEEDDEAEQMESLEIYLLKKCGYSDPYSVQA